MICREEAGTREVGLVFTVQASRHPAQSQLAAAIAVAGLGPAPRRVWLLMLFAMVFVLGWLFYAGIDPDEASAGSRAPTEQSASRAIEAGCERILLGDRVV